MAAMVTMKTVSSKISSSPILFPLCHLNGTRFGITANSPVRSLFLLLILPITPLSRERWWRWCSRSAIHERTRSIRIWGYAMSSSSDWSPDSPERKRDTCKIKARYSRSNLMIKSYFLLKPTMCNVSDWLLKIPALYRGKENFTFDN